MGPPASDRLLLAVNGGSSTVKFAIFRAESEERLAASTIEAKAAGDAAGAVRRMADSLAAQTGTLAAVGHRIVHGGARHSAPERLTPALVADLEALLPIDPEHLPGALALVAACRAAWPDVPQVACFDTAFHRGMPRVARILPLPRRFFDAGVERYGFHGLSYASLLRGLREADPAAARGRVVFAHLGSGASLAAVRDGKAMDTTMAFTPAAGVPMSTRSGDVDPGVVGHASRVEGVTPEGFVRMANRESGLLGVSETSGDMRELLARESSDPRAGDAVALFCYSVRKAIGAFAAALGGLETLVFSGGIGERSSVVRARVCGGLEFLGAVLDPEANAASSPVISRSGTAVTGRVLATDEEGEIARGVRGVLRAESGG